MLEEERQESFGVGHIKAIGFTKILEALPFVGAGGQIKEETGGSSQECCNPGRVFEVNTPGEQQQRTVERMPYVVVDTCGHQQGSFFENQKLGFSLPAGFWFAFAG